MSKMISLISSMKTMTVLMLLFAFVIGYATFIENDFGTASAKAEIYNATWFELLMALLTINLILNIFKYKMYTLKKAPIFIFHVGFIVIFIGAAITRYAGYEGNLHIREHQSASTLVSRDPFLVIQAKKDKTVLESSEVLYLSKRSKNEIERSFSIENTPVSIELKRYIPNVVEGLIEDKTAKAIINLMITSSNQAKQIALAEGEFVDNGSYILDFQSHKKFTKPTIEIYIKDNKLFMNHQMPLSFLKMDTRKQGNLEKKSDEPLVNRTLFTYKNDSFVLRQFLPHARKTLVTNDRMKLRTSGLDALVFDVTIDGKIKEVTLFSQAGELAKPQSVSVDGVKVSIAYGSKALELPFKIYLEDFQLDRYPGSMSPASYASEVVLIDEKAGVEMPFKIYMNHILEYDGYRFFQASYDPDEKGTILSVNHDPGTIWAYLGYLLLGIGMFWSLFSKQNRFAALAKKAHKVANERVVASLALFALVFSSIPAYSQELAPELKIITSFDKTHAGEFGKLIVQDSGGRMKPLNTLATEILAKIHRSSNLDLGIAKLDPNQIVLGMMIRPDAYRNIKLIRTKNKEINRLIGAREDAKYASFAQFFQDPINIRGYKLADLVNEANRKEPRLRNKLDKEILKVDERVNVTFMVFNGALIKIWPKRDDANNKWLATIEALQTLPSQEAQEIRDIAIAYFTNVDKALRSGDFSEANKALEKIVAYQKKYGAAVYPSQTRIDAEVFYNEAKIFERIYPIYLVMGFILLILSFVKILKPKFKIDLASKISLAILVVLFILHTIGLANRWYISGHAPWSDGYESMIYIGWATVLAGFIFSKRSPMTLASTGILTGLILFVAHLSWMNPQVTNLVPVLNSYWLSIHVSMITASYGFIGLGALLGFITLMLFIFKTEQNKDQIIYSIKELNAINEMSLMIGLVLLTVGNFLGGVWANESWGRYWGWDPKETWALVTILVYAVVVHLRFIKSLYSEFVFSVVSLLSFTSVLMTYFGVNYYLAGLHSYAKGDPVPIPDFVPISYAIVFIIIALAYRNRKIV